MSIHGPANHFIVEVVIVLIGVAIGTVKLAIKNFKAYCAKRKQRFGVSAPLLKSVILSEQAELKDLRFLNPKKSST